MEGIQTSQTAVTLLKLHRVWAINRQKWKSVCDSRAMAWSEPQIWVANVTKVWSWMQVVWEGKAETKRREFSLKKFLDALFPIFYVSSSLWVENQISLAILQLSLVNGAKRRNNRTLSHPEIPPCPALRLVTERDRSGTKPETPALAHCGL